MLECKLNSDVEIKFLDTVRTLYLCYTLSRHAGPDYRRPLQDIKRQAQQLAHDLPNTIPADRVQIRGELQLLLSSLLNLIRRDQRIRTTSSPPEAGQASCRNMKMMASNRQRSARRQPWARTTHVEDDYPYRHPPIRLYAPLLPRSYPIHPVHHHVHFHYYHYHIPSIYYHYPDHY